MAVAKRELVPSSSTDATSEYVPDSNAGTTAMKVVSVFRSSSNSVVVPSGAVTWAVGLIPAGHDSSLTSSRNTDSPRISARNS